ncbi:MAG TPA: hypothetical protein VE129_10475 [Thermoanaerobaculia bacterium]|nr:hypothetical protein [Thermoanaerobaculia bacterium]
MNRSRLAIFRPVAAAVAFAGALLCAPALADSAVVAANGTIYEVFPANYGDLIPLPGGSPETTMPALGLRISPSGQPSRLELIDGTADYEREGSVSVEFEETTGTLFVAFTKSRGIAADMHVTVRRDGVWYAHDVLSNAGQYYLSINPKVVVTRQRYTTFGADGAVVTKSRSIFSLVWWEESGPSQARYAPIFVEDGELRTDAVQAWNLNALAGAEGPTDSSGYPTSAYSHPGVQADPASNGGVLVTFANLFTRTQQVLHIGFPDDLVKISPPGSTRVPDEDWSRGHFPIGRSGGGGRIPISMTTSSEIGATVSQAGVTTFYWVDEGTVRFVRSDDPEDAAPRRLALRPDLSAEKATALVKALAEKN